jgi:hypothetical protein
MSMMMMKMASDLAAHLIVDYCSMDRQSVTTTTTTTGRFYSFRSIFFCRQTDSSERPTDRWIEKKKEKERERRKRRIRQLASIRTVQKSEKDMENVCLPC